MSKRRTVVDLFCDAGGLSAGLEMAGFNVLAGNDLFASAEKTFIATHPHAKFFGEPIQELKASQLLEGIGLKRGSYLCRLGALFAKPTPFAIINAACMFNARNLSSPT